jgi:hypothetical protein
MGVGHAVEFCCIFFTKLQSVFCNNIIMSKKINELNKQQVFYNERKLFLSKVFCNYK